MSHCWMLSHCHWSDADGWYCSSSDWALVSHSPQPPVLVTGHVVHWCPVQLGPSAGEPAYSFARLPAAAAPYIHANSHSCIAVTVSKSLLCSEWWLVMADFVEYKNWQNFLRVSTMQTLQNETKNCGGSTKGLHEHLNRVHNVTVLKR